MAAFNPNNFDTGKYYKERYGSVENLITQAKSGDVCAQGDLGCAYVEGIRDFVEKDSEKAMGWLTTAVENGDFLPSTLGKLAELHDLKGTTQHQRKAYELYLKAAQVGCPNSQINLAEMYRCGVKGVVNEDLKEAFKWYKIAAHESDCDVDTNLGALGRLISGTMSKMGNTIVDYRQRALRFLYKYYLEGDCPEGKPQPTKAVHYLTRAAQLGDTGAQLNLGKIYLNGSSEQIKDLKKAKRWLEKASASGHVEAKELLQQCPIDDNTKHDSSEVATEAFKQSFDILGEKFRQRAEANKHPFAIFKPVAFSEKMLHLYNWSPTGRVYLQAYKLVKEGFEVLCKSNFTDERGITLIAHGYLTENSILQAFPQIQNLLLPKILELCEESLNKSPCFFEGLHLSFALRDCTMGKRSKESCEDDLLQQCPIDDNTKHDSSEVATEAFKQSFDILGEKFRQRAEANKHPFAIFKPVAFSEEMLHPYNWSPTGRVYLQAYKMVKEGLEVLCKSNFTDERGITLISHGYLTENSILQAFPQIRNLLLPEILQLCGESLNKNPCFFEGLNLSFALRGYTMGKCSKESCEDDMKAIMCIMNLINFIQKAEPNSPPCEEPFEFDKNYSSWLHVLYYHLAAIYTISDATRQAAEAFENSLKCCPSFHEAKTGLGYSLMLLYLSKISSERKQASHKLPKELLRVNKKQHQDRDISKYDSWTAEKLRNLAVKVLKEYLTEAPQCQKKYPNACYYLANIHFMEGNIEEFRKYFELGQDAEEKRLPFMDPINLPLKDIMAPFYQHCAHVKKHARCGNRACTTKVKESDLKSCGGCGKQKYCSKHAVMILRHAVMIFRHAVMIFRHAVITLRHAVMTLRHAVMTLRHAVRTFRYAVMTLRHAVMTFRHAVMMFRHASYDIETCSYDIETCSYDIQTYSYDIQTCSYDIQTCSYDIQTCTL
ncbi:Uncharacterized protein YbeQ [Stylophora pistillata]|uniref:Uncharacterized protein YbeQ n=1 Tax=Stylophora pistillata TaxID=50429 RepID=A0A2B4R4X1_STYPI|nr:Uncharacterized protein YbeQ [Stylophora pistillata]